MFGGDAISDFLTRIRNAQMASLIRCRTHFSKLKCNILEILQKEGYILRYIYFQDQKNIFLEIYLKYLSNGYPVITEIHRVSKPSKRVYVKKREIKNYFNGMGMYILTTSKGVLSDNDAKYYNIGGEIICKVF